MKLRSAAFGSAAEVAERFQTDTGVPVQAMIEISDRCNEVCVHCYQEQGKKGEMDTGEVLALLDRLAASGVLFLTISGGEPTLRKDFLEILEHAHRAGFVIRLFTNGLTMTADLARTLRRCMVQAVEISVYSHRADVHDFVTGVDGSFERTISAIRHLVAERVMVVMKTPVMSVNEHELEEYVALATSLGANYSLSPGELDAREGGDRVTQMFSQSTETYARLVKLHDKGPQRRGPVRMTTGSPCGAGSSIHIEPNGEVRPCTLLEVGLGNVTKQSIEDVRAEPRLKDLRSLSWRDLHGCRDCELSGYCRHCYATALAETGDALGPYGSACRSAIGCYEAKNNRPLTTPGEVVGPFRLDAEGAYSPIPDRVTAEDDALAQHLGWARKQAGASTPAPVVARPGELIQLRRPGRKKPIQQRVPDGVKSFG